jgi:acyl carrier protein
MKITSQSNLDIRLEELVSEQAKLAGATVSGKMGDEAKLVDLGLDSLGFVTIIVEMQRTFGVDPFGRTDEITYPETFGQLKALYRAHSPDSSSIPVHAEHP